MKTIAALCLVCSTILCFSQGDKKKTVKYTLKTADSLFTAQQWNSAIPAYEFVLKSAPANALAWNRLGFSYHNISNYDKALSNYLRSLEQKPNVPVEMIVQSRLARIYALKNDREKAFESLDRALTLGYTNIGELQNHKDFTNLRSDDRLHQSIQRATENAMPCLTMPQARQFDFWIGEWDAYVTGTNNLAGYSRIDKASGGCMILENWTSKGNQAYEGKSMNFIDPSTNK